MLVSIITTTYNSGVFIESCLSSIKSQDYKFIEHILVDGASIDNTLTIVNQVKVMNQIIISEPDNGIYEAMNKGLAVASGDIIGFLNSDDFFSNSSVVSSIVKLFTADTGLEACYADLHYVDKFDSKKIVRYWKSNYPIENSFTNGWSPPHPTFYVKKSVYQQFGHLNLEYKLAADFDLMFRFMEIHKINTIYVPEVWVKMRLGGVTNKGLKNIIIQNIEIFKVLNSSSLKPNIFKFLLSKFFFKLKQFFIRN
jgi:glycosyltransferase involved in cell wall biosynthesis